MTEERKQELEQLLKEARNKMSSLSLDNTI